MKPGDLIAGKYRLTNLLGAGGMGEVWSTRNEATGREFAIKFMHVQVADFETARHRFSREARASARMPRT